MTNDELKEHILSLDEMSIELDVIMGKIKDHNTEIETLWDRYWEIFNKLTEMITADMKGKV